MCNPHQPAGCHSGHYPFNVRDLVMLRRVSAPQASPDGTQLLFVVRRTDYDTNQGVTAIHILDLTAADAQSRLLLDQASSPRWSMDGQSVYFLSSHSGNSQLWAVPAAGGTARQVTAYPVDVNNFTLSPDGECVAVSLAVFTDCADLESSAAKGAQIRQHQASGRRHRQLFVRHWDTWEDGSRSQLFVDSLARPGRPVWVSRGVEGDVPSTPFGDASEYAFSPDGASLYFNARLATPDEPWSTNFDIYAAPVDGGALPRNLTAPNTACNGWPVPAPDGQTLYYLAQKVPGYESDRFGIRGLDLASGYSRELNPGWDRSAGIMRIAADGQCLYVTAPDGMQAPLFAVATADGRVTRLTDDGHVADYALAGAHIVIAHDNLQRPVELFSMTANGSATRRLTHCNDAALTERALGAVEYFEFAGAHDEPVHGYVVKPADFDPDTQYPVAFIIHGGPQGVMDNSWSYRWNPQTYAGQGFAVVAINFHGSVGFGQAFTDAIARDWGGKPLQDLQKGHAYVFQQFAFLDRRRACALGASYGGYMVYWLAGQWPEPWRCLVAHDGVFDSRMMYYATEELWFEEHDHGGPQFDNPDDYERFNPVHYVRNWRVPMLVIHSERDYRIPVSQGLAAFTALQRRGIASELLTFADENHWVLKPHNSVMWHDTVNAWLQRWTHGDADT